LLVQARKEFILKNKKRNKVTADFLELGAPGSQSGSTDFNLLLAEHSSDINYLIQVEVPPFYSTWWGLAMAYFPHPELIQNFGYWGRVQSRIAAYLYLNDAEIPQ